MYWVKTNGTFEKFDPKTKTLQEKQSMVGGYIEHFNVGKIHIYVDEEALLKTPRPPENTYIKPFLTELFKRRSDYTQYKKWIDQIVTIYGDVLISKDGREAL